MTVKICCATCSTPFGIIGIFTERGEELGETDVIVLNAFRHHWNLHVIGLARRLWTIRLCAQRLSASLESSRGGGVIPTGGGGCSTPFGIIGIFTRLR